MEGSSNEGFQEKFTKVHSENLTSRTSDSKDTNEIAAVQYPITPIPHNGKNVDTDKITKMDILGAISSDRTHEDKVRLILTIFIITLFAISVIVGLIMFIVTGNIWLLLGAPVLIIPTHKVLGYYFYHPKEPKVK